MTFADRIRRGRPRGHINPTPEDLARAFAEARVVLPGIGPLPIPALRARTTSIVVTASQYVRSLPLLLELVGPEEIGARVGEHRGNVTFYPHSYRGWMVANAVHDDEYELAESWANSWHRTYCHWCDERIVHAPIAGDFWHENTGRSACTEDRGPHAAPRETDWTSDPLPLRRAAA